MKIRVFGIPSYAGALNRGPEQAPKALREAGLISKLKAFGHEVIDEGDIDSFDNLPRHNTPPVRNWPAPRIVWESIFNKSEILFDKESFTLILGGDCSIEVGCFSAFRKVYGENSYLLVLDGHFDIIKPNGDECAGAAGMGLWFLTQAPEIWWYKSEKVAAKNISVIGVQNIPDDCYGIKVICLDGIQTLLGIIPQDANIFFHFDVDALSEKNMPAAYAPSKVGLNHIETMDILSMILKDKRVKAMEITEFDPLKDSNDGEYAASLINYLVLL